jgi:hypothetical protein
MTVLVGGCQNCENGTCLNTVVGGEANCLWGGSENSNIVGGKINCVYCANFSTIAGGCSNVLSAHSGFIGGGTDNHLKHANSAIVTSGLTSVSACMLHTFSLFLSNIPTSDPGTHGVVWRDGTDLKVSI